MDQCNGIASLTYVIATQINVCNKSTYIIYQQQKQQ